MPRYVVNNPQAESEESSEEEDDDQGQPEAEDEEPAHAQPAKRQKISLQLGKGKGQLVCHVCGKPGHCAGFVGAAYMDCPNKPCYLCKNTGHTTMTCPYRVAPEHGVKQSNSVSSDGILATLRNREQDGRQREVRRPHTKWLVESAVLRLHSRRCTCLEFHPTRDNIVVSGDKKGEVAVWDFHKVTERSVYKTHKALTNHVRFLPSSDGAACCSAATDGTLKELDIETGSDKELLNCNPEGWITGVTDEKAWIMLYGLGVSWRRSLIAVGDSKGMVYFLDRRQKDPICCHQLHKKGNKVTSADFHPVDKDLLLTASNDWQAKLSDMRMLCAPLTEGSKGKGQMQPPIEVVSMEHPKVVNSAWFSPVTGQKIMTTCIDNRIRIWDTLFNAGQPADREIIHSHDFNRYLTPFRAEWDPKDTDEREVIIGRYISEDFGGVALHPVDVMDGGTGRLVAEMKDPNLQTICPVNKPHPRQDIIISGSSTSLYAWSPASPDEEMDGLQTASSQKLPDSAAVLFSNPNYISFNAGDETKKSSKSKKGGSSSKDDDSEPKKGKKK
ncbi:hypothetical protein WJX74_006309 [Apatococcus lobatus]|uniref:Protein DAMAGED DNA-BINDING 2 n=2 Tax=Apatococcus TaxID=904362 RepID=A0AAW1SYE1_9CHLO